MNTLFDVDAALDIVIHGDALEVLKTMPDECIDAIVCDPPAGISFMNKEFDHDKGGRTQWVAWLSSIMRECRRVLKSGGHALVWSLPRTSHWTALALEDAGFEIRDNIYNLVSGDTILLNFIQSLSEEQQHAFMQLMDGQKEPSGVLQVFGSGFPKSHNISVAIDKLLGREREVVGWKIGPDGKRSIDRRPNNFVGEHEGYDRPWKHDRAAVERQASITKPATPESEAYAGWGSNLKPACENWWLVRKPLAASSIAENVLQYGTGAINVDASRISHDDRVQCQHGASNSTFTGSASDTYEIGAGRQYTQNGRFPSHLLLTHTPSCIQVGTKRVRGDGHKTQNQTIKSSIWGNGVGDIEKTRFNDEDGMETVTAWECPDFCPVRILDAQGGLSSSRVSIRGKAGNSKFNGKYNNGEVYTNSTDQIGGYTDTGGPSRYFQQLPALDDIPPYIYAGKASRKDRNAGCEDIPEKQGFEKNKSKTSTRIDPDTGEITHSEYQPNLHHNSHPTVKSQPLMKYLTRMICPPNGIVLDCFAGSGSTLVAAIHEGFHFIGIEKEQEYVDIARKRIQHAMSDSGLQQPNIPLAHSVPTTVRKTSSKVHSSQLSLWDQEITA